MGENMQHLKKIGHEHFCLCSSTAQQKNLEKDWTQLFAVRKIIVFCFLLTLYDSRNFTPLSSAANLQKAVHICISAGRHL